jgi:hypothetical protein
MYTPSLPCGQWAGQPLADVPTSYLRWVVACMDRLDDWLRHEVKQELRRRGERSLPAALVLADLEEILNRRVSEDPLLDHEVAGIVSDHLLEAFEELRDRHGVGDVTELVLAPWPRKCGSPGDGRGEWAPASWPHTIS